MKIYTIGFTKKPASTFFGLLRKSGAERLVDVRLNNVSQLAGFAKRDDLSYFLGEIWWFLDLIAERQIEDRVSPTLLDNSVLLCSEATAHHCHRRLVAEYLAERWDDVTIEHL